MVKLINVTLFALCIACMSMHVLSSALEKATEEHLLANANKNDEDLFSHHADTIGLQEASDDLGSEDFLEPVFKRMYIPNGFRNGFMNYLRFIENSDIQKAKKGFNPQTRWGKRNSNARFNPQTRWG